MRRYDTVSLLTDYGTTDEFVGVVKAVIRDIAPHTAVIDLTHAVPAYDVRAGALTLARCISYVPSGVVLAVVDPGVGTERRAVAIEVADGGGVLVGPDNGLLAPAVALAGGAQRAVELTNPEFQLVAPGATFAGRDVFAPAAAHLCNGVDLLDLGSAIDPTLLVPGLVPLPRLEGDELLAEVLWVDHYGNCQLNIGPDDLPTGWGLTLQMSLPDPSSPGSRTTRSATRSVNFADLPAGRPGLVLDSYGMLAIAFDRRSAAAELGIAAGDAVTLRDGSGDTVESTARAVSFGRRG